jgi:glycosyltransferase involved in cell wall biosynthesis
MRDGMTRYQDAPLVTVIMNAYHSEEFLEQAIASVVAQTYDNWEIVLWENESSGETQAIAQSFQDERIRYFHAPDKVSLYESRMNAFREARGDLVAFLDCDDLWMPEKLSRQVPLFVDSKCVASCTDYLVSYEGDDANRHANSKSVFETYREPVDSCYAVALRYQVGMSSLMARTVTALDVWPFPTPRYSIIEDFDMVLRLLTAGTLVPIPQQLMVYRRHGNNFSSRLDVEAAEWKDWLEHFEMFSMTRDEHEHLRRQITTRLLSMKCREARLSGDRGATRRLAMQLPSPKARMKYLMSLAIPTKVVRSLAG